MPLSTLFKNEAAYRSFWTKPPSMPAVADVAVTTPAIQPPPNRPAVAAQPDNPVEVQCELARIRSMNDELHAKVDSMAQRGRGRSPQVYIGTAKATGSVA